MRDSATLPPCCQLEHSVKNVWIAGLDNERHSKVSSVSSIDKKSLYKNLTKLSKSVADDSIRRVHKIAKTDFMSVHVHFEQLGSHPKDFHEIRNFIILPTSVKKI